MRHEARDEVNVTAQAVQLGNGYGAAVEASAAASWGLLLRASAPLPVSTSTNSATISNPWTSAKCARAARWTSIPKTLLAG
jgi:hypothetical protein